MSNSFVMELVDELVEETANNSVLNSIFAAVLAEHGLDVITSRSVSLTRLVQRLLVT